MAIKKAYQEIISTLEANRDSTVEEILPTIIELASAKTGGGGGKATAHHKGEDGTVLAVRCFYHKKWISPLVVEFGEKKSSSTGLNSMCKDGVSKWTKQQRDYKKGKDALLDQLVAGEIDQVDVQEQMNTLEEARNTVQPMDREDGYTGFDSLEDCLADLEERGLLN